MSLIWQKTPAKPVHTKKESDPDKFQNNVYEYDCPQCQDFGFICPLCNKTEKTDTLDLAYCCALVFKIILVQGLFFLLFWLVIQHSSLK